MISVIFNLTDSSGKQLYTKVHLSPDFTPFTYSGSIILSNTVFVHDIGASTSINLVPGFYDCRLYGTNCESQFRLYFPDSLDYTTVYAADYMVNEPYPCPSTTCSYAITAGQLIGPVTIKNSTTGQNYAISLVGNLGNEYLTWTPNGNI